MFVRRLLLLAVLGGAAVPAARADVKPHPLFTDHMVLQRDAEVPVWGKADPGEKVTVTLAGTEGPAAVVETAADDKGMFKAVLPKRAAGTGFTLTIKGKNTVALTDVLVGDVWVCGGQSNMQWEFWRLNKDDQGHKVSAGAANPNIRLFTVARRSSDLPIPDLQTVTFQRTKDAKATFGRWEECKPEAVLEFSAVGYYFGREIEKTQKVPVGLLACNWGGTPAQAWASRDALDAVPELAYYHRDLEAAIKGYDPVKAEEAYKQALGKWEAAAAKAKADGKPEPKRPTKQPKPAVNQNSPSALFNGMLHAITRFPIKGAIWYQGESNAGKAAEYHTLFPVMIQDWRKQWGAEFPFLLVQLAPFKGGASGVDYAELRDAQFQATKKLPKVGIAVITDAGDETDIHPQKKEPVGQRLALAARAIAYGEAVEYRGPEYKSHAVEGDKVVISFAHAAGLTAKGGELAGFTVCGEDKVFHPAKAEVKGDTVVVSSEKVAKPAAVRFGWVNFAKPELNLFNGAGLPAVPFRTDAFPLTTAAKK